MDVYEREMDLAVLLREGGNQGGPFLKIFQELKRKENVIFTPHNAFNTKQSLDRKARQSIEAIETFLKHKKFPHRVPGT
jgi:D-lactate dehydrogenase